MAEDSEIERLDPEPVIIKLMTGLPVEVVRLRTRQLFRLMRILARGATPAALATLNFGSSDSPEDNREFASRLLGLVVQAIPEAENEAIIFLNSMCQPAGIVVKPPAKLSKAESESNDALFERFSRDMFNPELEDTLSILEVIIANEAGEIQALGKKLSRLWEVTRKAAAPEPSSPPPELADLHLPAAGPSSSTSSATSTAGATSTSSISPSPASARQRKPRAVAGT